MGRLQSKFDALEKALVGAKGLEDRAVLGAFMALGVQIHSHEALANRIAGDMEEIVGHLKNLQS